MCALLTGGHVLAQNVMPYGSGLQVEGQINAMAFDTANNRVFVAGVFSQIGGTKATNIAVLENGVWKSLGSGLNYSVNSLKWHDGKLYAAGGFSLAGGLIAGGIAWWDGNQWHTLPGVNGSAFYFSSIEFYQGSLYASGNFDRIDDDYSLNLVIRWDGTQWHSTAYPSLLAPRKMEVHHDTLWVWGCINPFASTDKLYAGYSTGDTSWTFLPYVQGQQQTNGFAFYQGKPTLVTYPDNQVVQWTGTTWKHLIDGSIYDWMGIATYHDDLYVIIDSVQSNYQTQSYKFRKFQGDTLGAVVAVVSYDQGFYGPSMADDGNTLWVYGRMTSVNNKPCASLVRYENNEWTAEAPITSDAGFNTPYGWNLLRDSTEDRTYVCGVFIVAGGVLSPNVAYVEQNIWHPMGNGLNGTVRQLVRYKGNIYACGQFSRSGATLVNNIAKWDGAQWVPCGDANAVVRSMRVIGDYLYATGDFTAISGVQGHLAKYDGTSWSAIGNSAAFPASDIFYDIAPYADHLIAITASDGIWEFDGTTWVSTWPGATDFLRMCNVNGQVFVGNFYLPEIYRWTGSTWEDTHFPNLSGDGVIKLSEMQGSLVATLYYSGLWLYKNGSWTNIANVPARSIVPLNNNQFLVTGDFQSLNGYLQKITFNHLAVIDFGPPEISIIPNRDTICAHSYVIFDIKTDAMGLQFEWHIPGGFPDTATTPIAIAHYLTPGNYPVWLKVHNNFGADSVMLAYQIVVQNCALSDKDLPDPTSLQVYPNPAADEITLIGTGFRKSDLIVLNTQGQVVMRATADGDSPQISVADLPVGLYFLQIQTAEGRRTGKFIKQ
jgi:hypothetical protein